MEKSQHTLYFGTRARMFKIANFQDSDVKRMLSKLLNIDKAALPKEELREVMDEPPGLQAHAPPSGVGRPPGGEPPGAERSLGEAGLELPLGGWGR